jgi:hypothetical protein
MEQKSSQNKLFIVIDPLITSDTDWESHFASILHGYIEATSDTSYEVIQINDVALMKEHFQSKYITDSDKVIFPNAWINSVPYIKHWCEIYNITPELIGFWSKGCYINSDTEYRPLNDRNWRKVRERGNFRCLDKSYFISEYQKEQFRIYVSKIVFPERLHVCAFPLDYLELEASMYIGEYYKQNQVIFPWNKFSQLNEQIMYDFIRVFKDIKVIFAQEKTPLERDQLLTQISKAKVAFLPYTFPDIGKEIYECVLLETIPLVPDIEGLEDLVPSVFRYPKEWTENIFNYSKHAPDLIAKIRELNEHYDEYLDLLKEHKKYLHEKYFDSIEIIEKIFDHNTRIQYI